MVNSPPTSEPHLLPTKQQHKHTQATTTQAHTGYQVSSMHYTELSVFDQEAVETPPKAGHSHINPPHRRSDTTSMVRAIAVVLLLLVASHAALATTDSGETSSEEVVTSNCTVGAPGISAINLH